MSCGLRRISQVATSSRTSYVCTDRGRVCVLPRLTRAQEESDSSYRLGATRDTGLPPVSTGSSLILRRPPYSYLDQPCRYFHMTSRSSFHRPSVYADSAV